MTTLAQLLGLGGGTPDVWTSGMTVIQNAMVISPTDGMIYQRKTATGSGATDPYNDRTNYRPANFSRVSSITSSSSAGTMFTNSGTAASEFTNVGVHSSPALSAGVRTNMLALTGRGALRFVALVMNTSLVTSIRAEVFIDGASIFDATYAAPTTTSRAIQIGYLAQINTNAIGGLDLVEFTKEAQVFLTSATAASAGQVRLCSNYLGYQS